MKFLYSIKTAHKETEFKQANKPELQEVVDEFCRILGSWQLIHEPLPDYLHLYIKRNIEDTPYDVTLDELNDCVYKAAAKNDRCIALTSDILNILITRMK